MLKTNRLVIENGVIKDYNKYYNTNILASIFYAIVSTIFIYKHITGIGVLFFALVTCIYAIYCMEISNTKIKPGSKVLMALIILLSISIFCTNDSFVIFVNYLFMYISLIIMFIHSYTIDENWQLGEYIKSFLKTVLFPIGYMGDIVPNLNEMNKDLNKTSENKYDSFGFSYIIIGLIASIFVLIMVLPALKSADYIFDLLIEDILVFNKQDIILSALIFAGLLLASFCGMKFLNQNEAQVSISDKNKLNHWIGITIFFVISIVYTAFSVIQIFALFLNKMELPIGITFSEYAREGFFQLLYVAIFNLMMIVVSFHLFNRSKVIKILLTIISINTYIMLASSVFRLILYIDSYQLTKLRLYAFWGLIVVFFGLTEAVISIYNERFKFVKLGFLILLILWTTLSLLKPEYIIAKYNLDESRYQNADKIYIGDFSADASRPIYEYIKRSGSREFSIYTYYYGKNYNNSTNFLDFNYSIYKYNEYKRELNK